MHPNALSGPALYGDWKSTVIQSARASDEGGSMRLVAVVDPLADASLPGILWELENSPEIYPLFLNTLQQRLLWSGPLFIPLFPGSKMAEWLFAAFEKKSLGIVFAVDDGMKDTLFEHLQNLLECGLPNGKEGLFRYYDPRVLYALSTFENREWLELIPGPAQFLYCWEPGRAIAVLEQGRESPPVETGTPLPEKLLHHIGRCGMPYAVMHAMKGEHGERLRAADPVSSLRFVAAVCDSIFALRFNSIHDHAAGVSLALQLGFNPFTREAVINFLQHSTPGGSLLAALRHLPDSCLSG